MIHAGIADCRMWDIEFNAFAASHQVLRFDMRGYGKSLPVEGEFNIQDDLEALLAKLEYPKSNHSDGMFNGRWLISRFRLVPS